MYSKIELRFLPIIFCLVLSLATVLPAMADGKKALRMLEKGQYEKLETHLAKSFKKDTINPGAWYVMSRLYFEPAYFFNNLDSAYSYVNNALRQFPLTEAKKIDKLQKAGISELSAQVLKAEIEQQAFQRAVQEHSIATYQFFIDRFKGSLQIDSAIAFRNELAYKYAVEEDTYDAFKYFLETYPKAVQVPEAQQRFETLLYRVNTKQGTLASFEQFLVSNPDSPFRSEAERKILEIAAADNSLSSYMAFIERFPQSPARKTAVDFMYHLFVANQPPAEFTKRFNILTATDSLSQIIVADTALLAPVYDAEKYGFMSSNGQTFIHPHFDDIDKSYLCGNITSNILSVVDKGQAKIISRLGHTIFAGEHDSFEDLGSGLIKIVKQDRVGLIHKSGRRMLDFNYEDIKNLENTFISFQYDGRWGLMSFTGKELLPASYDEIDVNYPFVIVQSDQKFAITNIRQIKQAADLNVPKLDFLYDDYLLMKDNHMLAFHEAQESLISPEIRIKIPLAEHKVYELFDGWMLKNTEGYSILDAEFEPRSLAVFETVVASQNRATLKLNNKWAVYYPGSPFPVSYTYDSIRFLSDKIGLSFNHDATFALFSNDSVVDISASVATRLLQWQSASAKSSPQYLYTRTARGQVKVCNAQGQMVIDDKITDIQPLGYEYLIIERGGKKGLYAANGKLLLRERYDGVAGYDGGYVSLLLNRKFGIYNEALDVAITPTYDRMIQAFSDHLLIASKNNKVGLIDKKGDVVLPLDYQEVRPWNDSVALVKTDELWHLWDIKNKKKVYDGIESFEFLKKDADETVLLIQRKSQVGVLSSRHGIVVGATFNDIINVGSVDSPLYFAEKYIQEAEFYIVIYYDARGKVLKKQVFTAEEYDNIYCG